ncbi:MAG: ABC transporter ATP-binding protein [Candidatus Entotheonellia bacterium]
MARPLLRVSDLRTYFISFRGQRVVKAVDGVSFSLDEGETLGLVGESGCGKTTTCHAIFRLLPPAGKIASGVIEFAGADLMQKSPGEMQRIRGRDMAMILQDPMASLNPLCTIFDQVAEPAYFHRGLRRRTLRARVESLLEMVRIPSPATRMHEYPHQMSGGMRQRIVGATALAGEPKLIVADEPTTNLDVTIQQQYLDLLKDLQRQTGVALIFVTHDLGIVAKMCDKVAVMYAGKIVEQGSVREIYYHPEHPYTEGLLKSVPRIGGKDALYLIPGQPPDLANLPLGCPFCPRCPHAMERCTTEQPEEFTIADGHTSRCWLPVQEGPRSRRFPGSP